MADYDKFGCSPEDAGEWNKFIAEIERYNEFLKRKSAGDADEVWTSKLFVEGSLMGFIAEVKNEG